MCKLQLQLGIVKGTKIRLEKRGAEGWGGEGRGDGWQEQNRLKISVERMLRSRFIHNLG